MFERFTDRARQVVVLAQEESRTFGHGYVGTEHLLLGLLLEEDGMAGEVLRTFDLSIDSVRAQVERLVDSPGRQARGEIAFTPRAKKSLLTASRLEAGLLGEEAVDTEHFLLALLREEEGMALRVLTALDVDADAVRDAVIQAHAQPGRKRPRARRGRRADSRQRGAAAPERLLAPIGLSDALLDGAGKALRDLAEEIDERLDRPADGGDLLILLASIPGGVGARTLAAVGIDADRLARAVEEVRDAGARSSLFGRSELTEEIEQVRREKEACIEAQEFEAAADARDRERVLTNQALEVNRRRGDEALERVRPTLGLANE
jgi:ATP-dependent Clp protease ATP-binding subunit ClpA